MTTATEKQAEKKVVVSSLQAGIAELDPSGNLQKAVDSGLVKAELDVVEIEAGAFSGDYVKLSPGDSVTDDASFVEFAKAISNGNLFAPKGEDGEPDTRAPHAMKFLVYGSDLAARSRTSQRIKSAAQGPEKSIERMVKDLMKIKPNLTADQAREMIKALQD